jgi:hypothetical protein
MKVLNNCKICGKQPEYHKEYANESTSSGYASISCCTKVLLKPADIKVDPTLSFESGWDLSNYLIDKCAIEAMRRWN